MASLNQNYLISFLAESSKHGHHHADDQLEHMTDHMMTRTYGTCARSWVWWCALVQGRSSIVIGRSRNCFTPRLNCYRPKAQLFWPKVQSMATTTAVDELEVTSSNANHCIIGTLSKRVAYVGSQFDSWYCWELFTGLEIVLPTVVSRGSIVRFPEEGSRLWKIACFLTPADGSNTLRLTIAESGGEYFIGGFVFGQDLAMDVVSLVAVSGPQPSAFLKFMAKNRSVSTIKRHRTEQRNPEMDEFITNQRARLPHVMGQFINPGPPPPLVPQHDPRARHPELPAVAEDFRREEALARQMSAEEVQHAHQLQQLRLELDEAKKDYEMRMRADGLPVCVTAVPMTAEQEAAPLPAGAAAELSVMAAPVPAESAHLPPADRLKTMREVHESIRASQDMLFQQNGDPYPPPNPPHPIPPPSPHIPPISSHLTPLYPTAELLGIAAAKKTIVMLKVVVYSEEEGE